MARRLKDAVVEGARHEVVRCLADEQETAHDEHEAGERIDHGLGDRRDRVEPLVGQFTTGFGPAGHRLRTSSYGVFGTRRGRTGQSSDLLGLLQAAWLR